MKKSKLYFFLLVVAINIIIFKAGSSRQERFIENYDYSTMWWTTGVVLDYDDGGEDDPSELEVSLQDGTNVTIIGTKRYETGEIITVYTDGTYYKMTPERVAMCHYDADWKNGILSILIVCFDIIYLALIEVRSDIKNKMF